MKPADVRIGMAVRITSSGWGSGDETVGKIYQITKRNDRGYILKGDYQTLDNVWADGFEPSLKEHDLGSEERMKAIDQKLIAAGSYKLEVGCKVRIADDVGTPNSEMHGGKEGVVKFIDGRYVVVSGIDGVFSREHMIVIEPVSEPTPKFKTGDTVRVIKENPRHIESNWVGDVGTIDDDNTHQPKGEHAVRKDKNTWNGYPPECLELVSSAKRELKIGDPVKIIDESRICCHRASLGQITTIVDIRHKTDSYRLECCNECPGCPFVFGNKHLELVEKREFNEGDRVRCIDAGDKTVIKNGEIYTVTSVSEEFLRVETKSTGWGARCDHYKWRFEHVEPESIQATVVSHTLKEGIVVGADWATPNAEIIRILKQENGRFEEVNDMKEEILNEVCKQLNIEVVGTDSGSIILKDGRIGNMVLNKVTITMGEAEQRQLIAKLPAPVKDRAFILSDCNLTFDSYEFVENPKPKSDVVEEEPSD